MEFSISVFPNQQCIDFVDQVMNAYVSTYDLPHKKEICFIVHELIINSVEAMEFSGGSETDLIEITVKCNAEEILITVIDNAGGIPEDKWDNVIQYDLESLLYSDRGRGLFFVKNMVDDLLFKQLSATKFLVSVSKKLAI